MDKPVIIPAYEPDSIARVVADMWVRFNSNRTVWLQEKRELRDYLFSTSTRTTTNAQLPWKNSTVTPKLTQIRDNLHANYMAALFPNEEWFQWIGDDHSSVGLKKRKAIENYMRQKLRQSGFEVTVEQLVLDYIDYGNAMAGHEYVDDTKQDPETGGDISRYRGPRAYRLSPQDTVIDPTAATWKDTPVIRRIVRTVGDLARDRNILVAQNGYDPAVIDKVLTLRSSMTDYIDQLKGHALAVDGFGSIEEYFASGRIEILELWGDLYDHTTGKYYADHVTSIIDRRWLLACKPNPSWLGEKPLFHVGWRVRPDNLWAQGPLDQLVGMQYRIDHLENLKADVFDQIANPFLVVRGNSVTDFTWGPGGKAYVGDEGDVRVLAPDTTALNADMQIRELMQRMEELAGAPQQAMGIRTPGEKTKYEVQVLENGAGRIFQAKVAWFEKNILEPLINSMLEESRRRLGSVEQIKVTDEMGGVTFIDVTADDLNGVGRLYPIGSRHFAEQARFVQDLTTTLRNVAGLPTVAAHFSGKAVARALNEVMGWDAWGIVKDNAAVIEQAETQRLVQAAQQQLTAEAGQPTEMQPHDYQPPEDINVPAGPAE